MRHSTSKFTFAKDSKRFIAEASELGPNMFEQIYPDACDQGIVLVSEKTGVETKWVEDRQLWDWEGELGGWVLIPTAETLRKVPALRGYEVHILND